MRFVSLDLLCPKPDRVSLLRALPAPAFKSICLTDRESAAAAKEATTDGRAAHHWQGMPAEKHLAFFCVVDGADAAPRLLTAAAAAVLELHALCITRDMLCREGRERGLVLS